MPKKLSLTDVKQYIKENDINNYCILLSDTYVNVNTPLTFQCNLCGNTFQKDFMHLKRNNVFCCQSCSKKIGASKRAIGIQAVKDFIIQNDLENLCVLLSEEYVNETSPLKFKCNKCNEVFYRDWAHLKRNRFQCPKCGIHQGATFKKYTKEEVEEDIAKKGYKMVGEYINAATPFRAICKRGHQVVLSYSYYRIGHSGCSLCNHLDHKGENHANWKGGSTETRDYLRKSISQWKKDVLQRDNYRCILTGKSNNDLVVHHLKGYNLLLLEASLNTGIPILSQFSDYKNKEYEILKEELIKLHKVENGVTLCKEIHNLFHSLYGKGNNTKEQFDEFSQRYKNNEFINIIK